LPLIVSHKPKEYTPAPEGLHAAVCVDVVDLGTVDGIYGPKEKVRLYWQIEDLSPDDNKPFLLAKQYTKSLHEKSALRKDLETWRGRKFTQTELDAFDLEKLLGVSCQLQVVHAPKDEGGFYANVQAIVPLGKGMTAIRAKDYVRKKDREDYKPAPKPTTAAEVNGSQPSGYDDDVPF